MLLPGVSGSFLLLMLGLYGYILHALRALIYSQDSNAVGPVLIFILGLITGLLLFSRLLKWLLAHYHNPTMAALAGLMLGSLRALWPFKTSMGHSATNTLPAAFDTATMITIAAFVLGVVIVTALHRAGLAKAHTE